MAKEKKQETEKDVTLASTLKSIRDKGDQFYASNTKSTIGAKSKRGPANSSRVSALKGLKTLKTL